MFFERNWPDLPGLTCYFAEGYRLQFHARDLVHLVRTNNLDLPGRPFENESPGGSDPNVLTSSHINRVTANSVYGKRPMKKKNPVSLAMDRLFAMPV